MEPTLKSESYKLYAIAAFPLIGIVNAIIFPPHDYLFSWLISLANIALLSIASLVSILAIKHTQHIAGKVSLGLLLMWYASFLIYTIWYIVKHTAVHT
jgi:hypothetical protein